MHAISIQNLSAARTLLSTSCEGSKGYGIIGDVRLVRHMTTLPVSDSIGVLSVILRST